MPLEPITSLRFNSQRLFSDFPPRFTNSNKKAVIEKACPHGAVHSGEIRYSRWGKFEFPGSMADVSSKELEVEVYPNFFTYDPVDINSSQIDWHLNFAHWDLFFAYPGPLFAQDEMQVVEHPVLGSLREALLHSRTKPYTVEDGRPTPILIMGAERRCRVATDANAELGRAYGLYGNSFSAASREAVLNATEIIDPPTVSNIIAIEAPAGGYSQTGQAYTKEEIRYILETAYSGFAAARIESETSIGAEAGSPKVSVHTGFWGCGAYGGHRTLMTLLQLIAAEMAGLDKVVFHAGGVDGVEIVHDAISIFEREFHSSQGLLPVHEMIDLVFSKNYRWGSSDGN
jgi:hypothetical protein